MASKTSKLFHANKKANPCYYGKIVSNNKNFINSISPSPTVSKLEEIRDRIKNKKNQEEEERKYYEYQERYNKALTSSIEEVETLLVYFLSREDVIIEKEYDFFSLHLYAKSENIYLRIGADNIEITTEVNNVYSQVSVHNKSLYEKHYSLIEEKFFSSMNNKVKNIVNVINDVTKMNRKTKISKLI